MQWGLALLAGLRYFSGQNSSFSFVPGLELNAKIPLNRLSNTKKLPAGLGLTFGVLVAPHTNGYGSMDAGGLLGIEWNIRG